MLHVPDVGEPSRAAMPPAERAVAQRAARLASGWGTHHEGVEEPEGIERPERGLKEGCFSFSGGARGGAVPTRSLIKFRNRSDEAGPGRRGEAGNGAPRGQGGRQGAWQGGGIQEERKRDRASLYTYQCVTPRLAIQKYHLKKHLKVI